MFEDETSAVLPGEPLRPRILIVLFALYAAITLVLTLNHEPWRDEADSWLVARDIPPSEIISWTRNAGTPYLWYALLTPLAQAGLPYISQGIFHLLIALAAAAVFLVRAPFGAITRALFLFSFYLLYQYAVIARTYSLGLLLTFCALALHDKRESRPIAYATIVALLCNTNAHSIGIAAAAILLYVIDMVWPALRGRIANGARHASALSIMIAGMAVAFVQLYTPGHLVPPNVVSPPSFAAFVEAMARAFMPAWESTWTIVWSAVLLIVVTLVIRKSRAGLVMLFVPLTALALIFTYLWVGGFRHYGLILTATIGALWLAGGSAAPSRLTSAAILMINVSLALSLPIAAQFAWSDLTKNYSGSKEMAKYLQSHGLDPMPIAAHPPAQCEAVLAHLRSRAFWYAALGEYGSYMKWDHAYRIAQATRVERAAAASAARFGNADWLFLSSAALPAPEQYGLILLYATHQPLVEPRDVLDRPNDERYWLYKHAGR